MILLPSEVKAVRGWGEFTPVPFGRSRGFSDVRRHVQRRVEKVGRNEPCPCGSGKKHKKCCGA